MQVEAEQWDSSRVENDSGRDRYALGFWGVLLN